MDAIVLAVLLLFVDVRVLQVLECGQAGEVSINISGLQTKMKHDTTNVDCHVGSEAILRAMGPCACITEWDEPSNDWIYCAIECRVDGRKLNLDYALYAKEQPLQLVREKRRITTTRSSMKGQEPSTVEKAKRVQESWDEQVDSLIRAAYEHWLVIIFIFASLRMKSGMLRNALMLFTFAYLCNHGLLKVGACECVAVRRGPWEGHAADMV